MADKFPTPDTIRMLKAVVEGSTTPKEWNAWIRGAEQQLCDREISRGSYLRLKVYPLPEARKLLERHGVSFTFAPSEDFRPKPRLSVTRSRMHIRIQKVSENDDEAAYTFEEKGVIHTAVVSKRDGSAEIAPGGGGVPSEICASRVKRKLFLNWKEGQFPDVTQWAC